MGAVLTLGSLPVHAAPASFRVTEVVTISPSEGGYFNGWPTVARLRNGSLMVVWSGGRDAHSCPFGRLESMVSIDDGASWSWPRVLFDSAIDDRDGGIMETSRGTLLVTTFSSVGFDAAANRSKYARHPEKWRRYDRAGPAEALADEAGPRILRSDDGGRNWSAVQKIAVGSPHGPIELADGRLLYPGVEGVGKGRFYKPGERKVGAWESRDDGRTWMLLGQIPAKPGDDSKEYHELHGVEAANGTIVVLIRSHADPANREMLQTESKDGGRTWSVPRPTGIFGYPPHLLKLRDGRLLLSYDNRRSPFGVQARISNDHGAHWSEPLPITTNAKKLDQGYPSTVQIGDGSCLTIWYETSELTKHAVLKQAKWTLAP